VPQCAKDRSRRWEYQWERLWSDISDKADVMARGWSAEQRPGEPVFAFRLHQFLSSGGSVYATLEALEARSFSSEGPYYAPKETGKARVREERRWRVVQAAASHHPSALDHRGPKRCACDRPLRSRPPTAARPHSGSFRTGGNIASLVEGEQLDSFRRTPTRP
jgi:hypothetical protein